mgnify:CR=1 FL=1|tara:strand:- start:1754 stop:3211 length:1458 start_codon:yes stop_codon:yes gene_type:complete
MDTEHTKRPKISLIILDMIYPFYLDKTKHNKDDTYIDITLDHPIICHDDEYLKLKILDVQYLNNMYNISSYLQNNIIRLIRRPFVYLDTTEMSIFADIYFDIETYESTTTLTYDTTNNIQFITGTNYKIHYKDDQIVDGVDEFDNVFAGNSQQELSFNEFENYIIVEKLDTSTDFLREVTYGMKKTTASTLTDDVTFRLKVEGSFDNVTYTTIPIMDTDAELITFTAASAQNDIITKYRIDLVNRINYKYYKFSIDGSLTNTSILLDSFVLNTLKLYSWPAIPYTIGADVTTDLVIPDGFYKATTYVAKIKELVTPYSMDITLDSLTNKVSITHSLTDNIKYPYTDPNGRVVMVLTSHNMQDNIGINKTSNTLLVNTPLVGDTNIDLVNYKKVIIATDLDFTNKTHNDLVTGNSDGTGVGNILAWIDADLPPFTCVKYNNYEMSSYRIENKNVSNIRFTLYNEKRQKLNLDNMLLHFEIEKLRLK